MPRACGGCRTPQQRSPLAKVPYHLRHAAVSTWLNAGVPAPQVAEWAGHSVHVLMRVYAKCIYGQEESSRHRIEVALVAADNRIERDLRAQVGWDRDPAISSSSQGEQS